MGDITHNFNNWATLYTLIWLMKRYHEGNKYVVSEGRYLRDLHVHFAFCHHN